MSSCPDGYSGRDEFQFFGDWYEIKSEKKEFCPFIYREKKNYHSDHLQSVFAITDTIQLILNCVFLVLFFIHVAINQGNLLLKDTRRIPKRQV